YLGNRTDWGKYLGNRTDWGKYIGNRTDWGKYLGNRTDWGKYLGNRTAWGKYLGNRTAWGKYLGNRTAWGKYLGNRTDWAAGKKDPKPASVQVSKPRYSLMDGANTYVVATTSNKGQGSTTLASDETPDFEENISEPHKPILQENAPEGQWPMSKSTFIHLLNPPEDSHMSGLLRSPLHCPQPSELS
ncbi:uncharacterized, partial [Tachysurus ichikawai]